MYKLIILLAVLLSFSAKADTEFYVNIHLVSKHLGSSINFNEENLGIGIEYDNWIAGVYTNSMADFAKAKECECEEKSMYVGRNIPFNDYWGIKLGGVTGYSDKLFDPMAAGYIRIEFVEITIIPPNPMMEDSPIAVGVGMRF